MSLDPNIEYEYEDLIDHPDREEAIAYMLAIEPEWTREDAIDYLTPSPFAYERDVFSSVEEMPRSLQKAIENSELA